ncbi:MAG: DUF1552 domain-containing protein [Acidobacteriota bacterium]
MFVTRKHISRRTALRGVGATIALPLLDSMVPAQTRLSQTAAASGTRLACIEMVHGSAGSTEEGAREHYWSPAKEGRDFEWSYSLQPLAALREHVTIVSGTTAHGADSSSPAEGGGDHFRSSAVFLTAAHAKQAKGPDVANGISIDQVYVQWLAKHGRISQTRVPSAQLCIENFGLSESCGFDYDCVYSETISWASETKPLPMTVNPRLVFEQLFGATGRAQSSSVVDGIADDRSRVQRDLGAPDRARVDAHLEEIRRIEQRIQAIEARNATAANRDLYLAPLGVPDSWDEHVRLMFDLQVLAFASETTRVSAFKMSRDTSLRVFPESGVKAPFHTLSHHSERPELIAEFAKINRYHVGLLGYFLQKLKDTPDGDGNLLDHSLVLYGSPMGDSHSHNHRQLPLLLAGRAGGNLKGNLHRICADGTPLANCLLTILQKLGVEQERFADSTGTLDV